MKTLKAKNVGEESAPIEYSQISECRKILKNKILHRSTFRDFQEEKENVSQLFSKTVYNNESNSALLIGPPGCGKTTLVRTVLEELSSKKSFRDQTHVVHLNGLLHTDDRLALAAISKQMNLENVVDDKVTGTFAESMALLLETLKVKEQSKSIIFILEEMGLFCSHYNQALLYNLFDIAHTNKASVCILGITNRLDVLDLMEKRVKSRFSHRHVYLMPQGDKEGFAARLEFCKKLLSFDTGEMSSGFVKKWNSHVNQLLQPGDIARSVLQKLFDFDTREQFIKDFLLLVVCQLDKNHPQLLPEDFNKTYESFCCDEKMRMAEGLSCVEICLLIAMKQLAEIYQGDPINFEMVYERYLKFAKQHAHNKGIMNKDVLMKAFEHLQALEFITPVRGVAGSSRVQQREFQMHNFQLTRLQVRELIHACSSRGELPTDVIQWADLNIL